MHNFNNVRRLRTEFSLVSCQFQAGRKKAWCNQSWVPRMVPNWTVADWWRNMQKKHNKWLAEFWLQKTVTRLTVLAVLKKPKQTLSNSKDSLLFSCTLNSSWFLSVSQAPCSHCGSKTSWEERIRNYHGAFRFSCYLLLKYWATLVALKYLRLMEHSSFLPDSSYCLGAEGL